MLGAMTGDIVGSIYEFHNHRSKVFEMFGKGCCFTDDTVMTAAVMQALLYGARGGDAELSAQFVRQMRTLGRKYPDSGYGLRFSSWLLAEEPTPYNSYGNGSAMRVSPCGFYADTVEEAMHLARLSAEVTHNHPEGVKGAEVTAGAVFLARTGADKTEIRRFVEAKGYNLQFTLDEIRETYSFNETCQDTVPQAIVAFLESSDFEDAIRCAISVGGDSDTLAAITGGIAEAFYGIPQHIREKTLSYLPADLREITENFYCAVAE
ncbi:MAG: ADP-ribosylglycohydrolase family protein [Candidatus Fimenecus sp.]